MPPGARVFLLSPASAHGRRSALLLNPRAGGAPSGAHLPGVTLVGGSESGAPRGGREPVVDIVSGDDPAGDASDRGSARDTASGDVASRLVPAAALLSRRPDAITMTAFELAQRLREPEGAPLGEVFAFVSSLYFRGKLAYARAFATSAFVITPSRGLMSIDALVTCDTLRDFATVNIDPANPRYREPLERDLARLAAATPATELVLLGSVASGKYIEILLDHVGDRLLFPETFVGRGDMSRGGVMLRAAQTGEELTYIRAAGAVRRGSRPPKLEPA